MGLALFFGLDEMQLGIVSSFPMVAQIFQIVSVYMVERARSRKLLAGFSGLLSRLLWSSFILLSMLFLKAPPVAFIIVFGISQIVLSFYTSALSSLMRDAIPQELRGNIVGKRNLFSAVVTFSTLPLFSFLIERDEHIGYTIFALSILIFSVLSFVFLSKVDEVPRKSLGALAALKEVILDRNFMKLASFFFYWNFVVMLSSPFFSYHLIKNLHVPFSYIGLTGAIGSGISIISSWHYSKIADEIGHKSLAQLGMILTSMTGFIWFFMGAHSYKELMLADSFLSGFGWSAMGIALLTLPMEVSRSSSTTYFLVYYTFGGFGGLLGAILGGFIGKMIASVSFQLGELEVWGLQVFFLICGILRLSGVKLIDGVSVRRHVPVRKVLASPFNYIGRRVHARYMEMVYLLRKMRANGVNGKGKIRRSRS